MSPPPDPPRQERGKVLVAGIGHLLGDDGFGRGNRARAHRRQLPPHVEAVDIGVRGVHLAYQVLDGYDTLILVDATARGERPGTLYVIEHDGADAGEPHGVPLDGHRMTPDTVLALLGSCATTGGAAAAPHAGRGMRTRLRRGGHRASPPVSAAVPEAVRLIEELLRADEPGESAPRATVGEAAKPGEKP